MIRVLSRRLSIVFCVIAAFFGRGEPVRAQAVGELIERTLAIVGGQVISLSDVRTALALHLIESRAVVGGWAPGRGTGGSDVIPGTGERNLVRDPEGVTLVPGPGGRDFSPAEKDLGVATSRLIDRLLVLREVQRYAPPEPADALVDEQLAAVRARVGSPLLFAQALEAGGFTEGRLRAWLRDDLRIASYLSQRFAAAGTPSDDEVTAYYTKRRGELERDGLSFERAAPLIRDRLSEERRTELIDEWIADLRRRVTVVELWK